MGGITVAQYIYKHKEKQAICCCGVNYETHLRLSLHVLVSGEELLSLSLASSVGTESGLSELEGSLQSSGSTDLDELDDAALIGGETSDLLHDLTDHGVPKEGLDKVGNTY